MALPIDKAELISLFVESTLWGIFLVLFVIAMYVLIMKRQGGSINKPMLVAGILMFIFGTIHVTTNFARMIDAFITNGEKPNGPAVYLKAQAHYKNMLKSTSLVAHLLVGDALITYRTYIIWGRNIWVTILPALLCVGTIATGTGVLHGLGNMAHADLVFIKELSSWIQGELILTFCNQIVCTLLIAYRIWSVDRKTTRVDGSDLRPIITIVVESGALAAFGSASTLITYMRHSNAQYICLDSMGQLTSIAFTMIIVRVSLGLNKGESSRGNTTGGASFLPGRATANHRGTQPMAIHVTRTEQIDADAESKDDYAMSDYKAKPQGWSPA
jgi:hypothetical protein